MPATRFAGWLPNVGGRLSFSHIGSPNHPKPCSGLNEADAEGRILVRIQQRPLSDGLLSERYVRWVYGYETTWFFVLIAQTEADGSDQQGKLTGQIYAFPRSVWSEVRDGSPALRDRVAKELTGTEGDAAALRLAAGTIADILRERADFVTSCTILRSGKATLSMARRHSELAFAPAITESPKAIDDGSEHYLCNQAFIFLKDIAHSHRHHHKRQDTITLLHPEDEAESWIRESAYSIHRRVVVKRRSKKPKDLFDAMGLMAYMASLKKLVDQVHEDADTDLKGKIASSKIAASYNLKETEDSIKAMLEYRKWKRVQWNIGITALPALIIALGALTKKAVIDQQQPELSAFSLISDLLVIAFPANLFGLLSISICMLIIPTVYGLFSWLDILPVDKFRRLLLHMGKSSRAASMYSVSAILTLIALAIGFSSMFFSTEMMLYPAWAAAIGGCVIVALVVVSCPYWPTLDDLVERIKSKKPVEPKRPH